MSSHDVKEITRRMEGALQAFRHELAGLRTGRASAGLLEPVMVDAYGSHMPLSQLASVSAPEPRLLTVQVWDNSMTKIVEKAIANAGLGLNPMAEGSLIRVPLPELTEERRKELVKVAHKYAEQTRVAVRNIRRDALDALKKAQKEKDSGISEDDVKRGSDDIQKLTDKFTGQVETVLAEKEKEILAV